MTDQTEAMRAAFEVNELDEAIKHFIAYDHEVGALFWKNNPNRSIAAEKMIGRPNSWGHICFGFRGKTLMAHRVAWFIYYGTWPKYSIDHMNGNPSDNRIANLRDVPQCINQQNKRRAHKNNKTGLLGVSRHQKKNLQRPWRACIKAGGKSRTLGFYSTPEDAHLAYIAAKKKLHEGYLP